MPSIYRKKVGPSQLFKYSRENMSNAVKDVNAGKGSIREIARKYEVPKSTLAAKVKGNRIKKHGGQPIFNAQIENYLVTGLLKCAEWGFPLTASDTKDVVKSYLDRCGVNEKRFPKNRPGKHWMNSFLTRHPDLTVRLSENIKRSRAAVDRETINKYFDELERSMLGVPPENIVNYDETNFCDDPGQEKILVRRGSRHPERILDSSKSATSVMFAVAGNGVELPPYVVYKASYLYPTWVENGIPQARYNSTPSGWFDMNLFEDWFMKIALPYFSNLAGPKVLIGDNLASHISVEVTRQCDENDIRFLLLPPNSTHLTQPLDVAVFRPVKIAWRKVLHDWKKSNRGLLPKALFPGMLKNALNSVNNMSENIISGFKACGLVPVDRQKILCKIPSVSVDRLSTDSEKSMTDVLIDHLSAMRKSSTGKDTIRPRGKRINILPGKSVSAQDIPSQEPDTSKTKEKKKKKTKGKTSKNELEEAIRTVEEEEEVAERGASNTEINDEEEEENLGPRNEENHAPTPPINATDLKEKDFLLVRLQNKDFQIFHYVCQVEKKLGNGKLKVSFMRKTVGLKMTYFTFPQVPDIDNISNDQILQKLVGKDLRRGKMTFTNLLIPIEHITK